MTSNDEVISDEIVFRGHENVRALHPTTIEITRDNAISMRADCVIGVGADKGCGDLNEMWVRRDSLFTGREIQGFRLMTVTKLCLDVRISLALGLAQSNVAPLL